ncbi:MULTISPECIES: SSI family serine proteinase inhibitor [unclassified Streptomyces]|uniref:SSI family serine proteinase inhibitor n=1 Tax=unclassified Streptomyces TaxID=2593676 RepID=UPI00274209AC|nr:MULTISPECIES: SSI family serine proteinase inhibitor [unclassified Streptomyces]
MTHFSKTATRLRRGTMAAAALLLAAALPAQAAHGARTPHRHSGDNDWLYVTVTHGDTRSGDTRGALLRCDPPRGHSHATLACAQLRSARGDIRFVPHKDDVICSMIYAPVTVQARGEWQGRAIDYTETFANQCVMEARTGEVFALDA